jgi:peptidoglycan hydrolase-like protein with peptidoglycan-binding domain
MNVVTFPLQLQMKSETVHDLHEGLSSLGFTIADEEKENQTFGSSTREAVAGFQRKYSLEPTGVVDERTAAVFNQLITSPVYTVDGTIASPDRVGVGGLTIHVVDRNVGTDDTVMGEAITDSSGSYHIQFSLPSSSIKCQTRPDLQARVYSGETLLAASDVRYNATTRETLNVWLPPNLAQLPSEYESLTAAIAIHYSGKPGNLIETDTRQDITYLANKTGWDARLVAIAALADQFSHLLPMQREIPGTWFIRHFTMHCSGQGWFPVRIRSILSISVRLKGSGTRPSIRV